MHVYKSQRKYRWWKLIFLMLLIIAAGYYFRNIYPFLSISRPVEPSILVAEGWLNEEALELAREEFLLHEYKLLLTTGLPYKRGYMIGSNGKVVFETGHRGLASPDSTYRINLLMRGTKSMKAFAHVKLFADSLEIGDFFSSRKKRNFTCDVKLDNPPSFIAVEFDNDTYTKNSDRNLFIYSVTVNNQVFMADNEKVTYYIRKSGKYYFRFHFSSSSAEDVANFLISSGIPDSMIIPLVTTRKIKSKTYTTALDLNNWLQKNRPAYPEPVTIFSPGPHARRSWISYRKAFGDSIPVGVISCPDRHVSSENWWKTRKGWRKVLYETAGVVYATVVL
ncbi:MAG TPA: carbohydrate-binding domain-containing protein [Bacteroidales bacterium]|nr:carbohydrate-binding domain-containing protein [Bacteroidales bacterium]